MAHTCVYRCSAPSCRLQFAEPQPNDEALANAYRRLYYPGSGCPPVLENTPREVIAQIFRGIRDHLGELAGKRLLDYGCGTGELSTVARGFGIVPVGIEQDPEARREIERQSLFPVYPNLESLERQAGQCRFDLVVLWQVVEHLRRPWDDLAHLRGLLAANGWLVAATPRADSLKARLLRSRWDNYSNPTHLYYFVRSTLEAVFKRAGLSPVEEWTLSLAYPDHGWLQRQMHSVMAAVRRGGDLILAGGSGAPGAGVEGRPESARQASVDSRAHTLSS